MVELQPGAELTTDGVRVVATPLEHGGDPLARAIGYMVFGDGPSAFLCGDSGYGPAFAQVGAQHAPDVAFLPIGGFLPWSFRARHMSPLDALYAFEDLRARVMVPIHHGAFALSYERLGEPARWLRELVDERELAAHVRALVPGESAVWRGGERARPERGAGGDASGDGDALAAGAATRAWAEVPPIAIDAHA